VQKGIDALILEVSLQKTWPLEEKLF
jgi:hypothetical protein